MTGITLTTVNYEDQAGQVTWRGVSMRDDAEFNTFMSNDVSWRLQARKQAKRVQIFRELHNVPSAVDDELIRQSAEMLEIAVLDLVLEDLADDEEKQKELKLAAADAFRLFRVLPRPKDPLEAGMFLLRAGALAVLGDKGSDAARWMKEEPWLDLPTDSEDWRRRTWATVLDVWLRLIRKDGWSDLDKVLERISRLRDAQADFEKDHLEALEPIHAKAAALELIGLYHLAKAAEISAHYMTDGGVDGRYQIRQLLDPHFDQVLAVCNRAQLINLESLSRLLAASASQIIKKIGHPEHDQVAEFAKQISEV